MQRPRDARAARGREPEGLPKRALAFGQAPFVAETNGVGASRTTSAFASDPAAIRVETELVIGEYDVRDKKGKRVAGLNESDFKLEEDGMEQQIDMFFFGKGSAAIGRSIILVIDYSHSQVPYIETSVNAAKILVDLLEPNDRMAVVTDDVELVVNFTGDKTVLKDALDTLKERSRLGKYGMSRQFSALYAAVSQLLAEGEKRPVVIFQTDGDEFGRIAVGPPRSASDACHPLMGNFNELEAVLERAGTTVHSIVPGLPMDNLNEESLKGAQFELDAIVQHEKKMRKRALEGNKKPMTNLALRLWAKSRRVNAAAVHRISEMTGGTTQYLASPKDAQEVYTRILDEMNQRYLIGYYPVNIARDGKKRTIRVSLRRPGNYSILGRTSYIPAPAVGSR